MAEARGEGLPGKGSLCVSALPPLHMHTHARTRTWHRKAVELHPRHPPLTHTFLTGWLGSSLGAWPRHCCGNDLTREFRRGAFILHVPDTLPAGWMSVPLTRGSRTSFAA